MSNIRISLKIITEGGLSIHPALKKTFFSMSHFCTGHKIPNMNIIVERQ